MVTANRVVGGNNVANGAVVVNALPSHKKGVTVRDLNTDIDHGSSHSLDNVPFSCKINDKSNTIIKPGREPVN